MTTRMLLLPADQRAPARCVHLDDGGRVLAQATLLDASAQPAPFAAAARTVLVVPGTEVRTLWLELPAHSKAQALAAARRLVAESVAMPGELHVAVSAAAEDGIRAVAVVERTLLRGWLDRAAAMGMPADSALPEQLLLPPPDDGHGDGEAVRVFDAGDRWLVRGAGLAFSAEPDLAAQVVGDRPRVLAGLDDFERAWSRARAPELELLQADFAPVSTRSAASGGKRRLAWLAAALLASPLLLVAAQALRLELAARGFEARAAQTLQAALPAGAADVVTPEALRARLADAQAPRAFAAASGALFAAVAARPGTRLESLDYHRGDGLRATMFHPSAEDLAAMRDALAAEGWRLLDQGSGDDAGGLVTEIALEPAT